MKTSLKYFAFLIVTFLLFKSDAFALTCDYNVSGYIEDDINWTLDMDTGTAKMKKTINSLMYDTNKSEDIINWNNSSYRYNAKGSSSCPKYLIQSKGLNCLGIICITDNRMFAADESSLTSILSEKELQRNTHREVHVMQLATRNKSTSAGATCNYSGVFNNSYFGIEAGFPIEISLYYDSNGNLLDLDSNLNLKYGEYVAVSYSVYNTQILGDTCNSSMAICQASDNKSEHDLSSYTFYLSGIDRLAEDTYSYSSNDRCETFNLRSDSTDSNGNTVTSGEYCPAYDKYWTNVESYAQEYKSCVDSNGSDCAQTLQKFNQEVEKLQAICKSSYSTMNYGDTCVNKCVKELDQNLSQLKFDNNISVIGSNNANCGLSARLAAWILKIINWMRYIVPVLLILLSVLDFIKAIAADSEDEIKKVTSKFVKRLIVVVIIFILPLALEFLLGIFGRDTNNFCL